MEVLDYSLIVDALAAFAHEVLLVKHNLNKLLQFTKNNLETALSHSN